MLPKRPAGPTAANTSLTLGGRQFLSSSLSPILSRVFTAKCSLSESPPCPVSLLGSKPLKLGAGRALSLCFSASIISMECLTGNKGFFKKLLIFCCQGNKLFSPFKAPSESLVKTLLRIDEYSQSLTELTWSRF